MPNRSNLVISIITPPQQPLSRLFFIDVILRGTHTPLPAIHLELMSWSD